MTRQGMFSVVSCLLCYWLLACTKPPAENNAAGTTPPAGPTATTASNPSQNSSPLPLAVVQAKESPAPSPKITEVRDTVKRVFENVAEPTSRATYVVGDFNGDGSEDLAVVVKPNEGKLAEVNDEMANWILEDPRKVVLPRAVLANPAVNKPAPVRAEKGDTLLAIIHGAGPQGWRNSEARQTFLLKNGAGANIATQPMKSLKEGKNKQRLPPIRGDAIHSVIGGKSGLILWTGAKYAWYVPGQE